ncbi:MAG: thioredoxin [Clostridiales bacterium]
MAIIKLNGKNFEAEALKANEPVLVDFWAEWCGPCRMLSPLVDEIANELDGKVKIGKVNVDEEPELAREYGVMSIPTLVVLKEGKVAASSVGVRPKEEIIKLLEM